MNQLGTCQICKRTDVPLRSASSQALNEVTFVEIIESLLPNKIQIDDFEICFKCQENAIIAHEFKSACVKNFNQLDVEGHKNIQEDSNDLEEQHISDDIEEQQKSDFIQEQLEDNFDLNEIQQEHMDHDFDDLIAYEGEGDLLEELEKDIAMDEQFNEPEETEIPIDTPSDNDKGPEAIQLETLEEFIIEEEVIAQEVKGKRYRCNICNKFFGNRDSLNRHKFRHENSPKLKCPYCPRAFYFSRDLNFHLKQHLEPQKDYKCEICDKYYGTSSSLKKHLDLHTKSKEFKCTYEGCNMVFTRKYTLENHMLTHSNVRPFKCTICEASFNQKNILQRHMKSCHNENFFKCEYCKNVSFEKKSELKDHYTDCDEFLNSRQ